MPRYRLTIEYDGGGYAGWQSQPDRPSVQGEIEAAVTRFCGESAKLFCAGRTDAGVHARGQVAHVDLLREEHPFTVMQAINFHLIGHAIAIVAADRVDAEFHARFSARRRIYRYLILNRRARSALDAGRAWHVPAPLDPVAMREAAQALIGTHDFTTFRDSECQASSPLRTLDRLDVTLLDNGLIGFDVEARSFLHHQVRNMVGTLSLVGGGRWTVEDFVRARDAKDRRAGGPTAPACGLTLTRVDYDS